MFKKDSSTLLSLTLAIVLMVVVFYVLYIGASLIIPFIIAVLFSFALIGLQNFYKLFKVGKFFSFILALATYGLVFWGIGKIINTNIEDLIILLPDYQTRVIDIIRNVLEYFHINEVTGVNEVLQKVDIQSVVTATVGGITSIFSSAGIIFFYVIFILLEYRHFSEKLNLIFTDSHRRKQIQDTIQKIKKDIKSYFVIKTVVSLITSIGSLIVMSVFNLDFMVFWAFVIFLLNFIPSIGSVIAVGLVVLFSLVALDNYYAIAFMGSGLIGMQILMGNIIEPRFVGNKLNLSPLVIIIALAFWGTLWGVVGMLLSVPIMVIINIILGKIPATRGVAILLSEKGELQVEAEEVVEERKRLLTKVKDKFKKKKKKKK